MIFRIRCLSRTNQNRRLEILLGHDRDFRSDDLSLYQHLQQKAKFYLNIQIMKIYRYYLRLISLKKLLVTYAKNNSNQLITERKGFILRETCIFTEDLQYCLYCVAVYRQS